MSSRFCHLAAAAILAAAPSAVADAQSSPATTTHGRAFQVVVTLASRPGGLPHDGRLLLAISTDSTREPRLEISDQDNTQQLFGIDVHGLSATEPGVFDSRAFGYPQQSLADIRPGDYWVQAILHPYEIYHLADGHTVELPPDHGEGQQWTRAPGSPMSRPKKVHIDPRLGGELRIVLDTVVPPLEEIPDTRYVKHVRIQSDRLTKFWGRPTFLERDFRPAGRLRLASRRALSAGDLSGPLPENATVVARGTARFVAPRTRYGEDRPRLPKRQRTRRLRPARPAPGSHRRPTTTTTSAGPDRITRA